VVKSTSCRKKKTQPQRKTNVIGSRVQLVELIDAGINLESLDEGREVGALRAGRVNRDRRTRAGERGNGGDGTKTYM